MKNFVLTLLLLSCIPVNAQRFITKTGHINFYSHTPLEDIKADNNQVASIMDVSTGEIVFQVLVKSFKFERALMEEHFNENYMESDKFPRSTFKGKITHPDPSVLKSDGKHDVTVEGELMLHNVTKKVSAKGTVENVGGIVNVNSKFEINPADYNIEIPSVVREKIAKTMEITVEMKYTLAENN